MTWLCVLGSYLIGAIPFGLLAGFICGRDIRREGSGNIGATNVMRTCGWPVGIAVLLLDALKGFAPVFWIAPVLIPAEDTIGLILTGLAAILGHNFPVWLRFRGGRAWPPQPVWLARSCPWNLAWPWRSLVSSLHFSGSSPSGPWGQLWLWSLQDWF